MIQSSLTHLNPYWRLPSITWPWPLSPPGPHALWSPDALPLHGELSKEKHRGSTSVGPAFLMSRKANWSHEGLRSKCSGSRPWWGFWGLKQPLNPRAQLFFDSYLNRARTFADLIRLLRIIAWKGKSMKDQKASGGSEIQTTRGSRRREHKYSVCCIILE